MMKQVATISYGIPLPYDWNSYILMDAIIDFSQRKMKSEKPTKYWQQYKSNVNRLLQWKDILQQKSNKSLSFSWQQQTQFVPFPKIFIEMEQESMEKFQTPVTISLQGFCKQNDTLQFMHQFTSQTQEDIIQIWKQQIHSEMQFAIVLDRLCYSGSVMQSDNTTPNMVAVPQEKLYYEKPEEEKKVETEQNALKQENPLLKPCLILRQFEKDVLQRVYEEFVLQNTTIQQAHQEWIKKQMELRRKMVHSNLKVPEPTFFAGVSITE